MIVFSYATFIRNVYLFNISGFLPTFFRLYAGPHTSCWRWCCWPAVNGHISSCITFCSSLVGWEASQSSNIRSLLPTQHCTYKVNINSGCIGRKKKNYANIKHQSQPTYCRYTQMQSIETWSNASSQHSQIKINHSMNVPLHNTLFYITYKHSNRKYALLFKFVVFFKLQYMKKYCFWI